MGSELQGKNGMAPGRGGGKLLTSWQPGTREQEESQRGRDRDQIQDSP